MNQQRDKFLTEAMGIKSSGNYKVGITYPFPAGSIAFRGTLEDCESYTNRHKNKGYAGDIAFIEPVNVRIINFSTWPSFGKLWEWAINQKWWQKFAQEKLDKMYYVNDEDVFPQELINPDNFANAVYDFLKEK